MKPARDGFGVCGRVARAGARINNVAVVSFDPADKPEAAAKAKEEYRKQFGRASYDAGFHFLTGDQASIAKLASAVGWRYRWDEQTKPIHPRGGIMVATPDGKLSRYFYGIDYAPADLRMALVDASQHKIGSPVDYVFVVLLSLRRAARQVHARDYQHPEAGGRGDGPRCSPVSFTSSCETTRKSRARRLWKEARHAG